MENVESNVRPEFAFHRLNNSGQEVSKEMGSRFNELLTWIEGYVPAGRELAIVKTKLEEACFFAKKGMATQPTYQEAKQ